MEWLTPVPPRAEMALELLDDPANILPAFEALTVLEGTGENAKQAWNRCVCVCVCVCEGSVTRESVIWGAMVPLTRVGLWEGT